MNDGECLNELVLQVHDLNKNLAYLINMLRYEGKYDMIEEDITPQSQQHKIIFGFSAKQMTIRANQPITVHLNHKKNPAIYMEMDEYPWEFDLKPAMLVDRIFISTGNEITHVKITILG